MSYRETLAVFRRPRGGERFVPREGAGRPSRGLESRGGGLLLVRSGVSEARGILTWPRLERESTWEGGDGAEESSAEETSVRPLRLGPGGSVKELFFFSFLPPRDRGEVVDGRGRAGGPVCARFPGACARGAGSRGPPWGTYGDRGAAGLRGCPRERLPSRLCTPGRGGAGPERRVPTRPRCLPWGLTFHFSPSSKSQAGPTSQTCKLRPENLQRHLGAQ